MNRATLRWLFFTAAILAGLSAARPSPAAPEDQPKDRVFVGYAYGRPRNINIRLYTHLCHAFLIADGEGHVSEGQERPEP